MYRLGTATRTAQGLLIVQLANDRPEIGDTVLTEQLTTIGSVVDVFGPVNSPYVAVSPTDRAQLPQYLGEVLYARSQ